MYKGDKDKQSYGEVMSKQLLKEKEEKIKEYLVRDGYEWLKDIYLNRRDSLKPRERERYDSCSQP